MPSGIYNTVATYRDSGSGSEVTTTILSVLTDHDLFDQVIQFAAGNTNSVLTVERMPETTPYVVVGGLEREAASVRTESGSPDAAKVQVDMNVTPADQTQNQTEIQAIRTAAERAAAGLPAQGTLQTHVDLVLDIGLTKTLSTADPEKITSAANILELVIPYPMEGKANILVHRFHSAEGDREGAVTFTRLGALPENPASRADKTFYLDADNDLIRVFAQKFSLYAVSYTTETPVTPPVTPPADPPASSGGGGGSRDDDDERGSAAGLLDTEDHRDYLHGFRDGFFRPDASMTRAQAAAVINRLLGRRADEDFLESRPAGLQSFPDALPGYWAYEDIMEAANAHDYRRQADGERWTALHR